MNNPKPNRKEHLLQRWSLRHGGMTFEPYDVVVTEDTDAGVRRLIVIPFIHVPGKGPHPQPAYSFNLN